MESWPLPIGLDGRINDTPGQLGMHGLSKMPNINVHCNQEHFGVEAPPMKRCGGFYDRNERK
jgi:hypothetical protein